MGGRSGPRLPSRAGPGAELVLGFACARFCRWITIALSYAALAAWGGTLLGLWHYLPTVIADVALSAWLVARIMGRIGEARVQ